MTYVEILKDMIRKGEITEVFAMAFLIRNGMYADKVRELLDA
jgi:hypothetical protein